MSENVGFRVVTSVNRLPKKLVESFTSFGVANLGDALGRFGVLDYHIKPINKPGVKLVGSAITVRVRPGDNLMIHKALDLAEAGDVLVVDVQGSPLNGLWGALMTETAMHKGVAGLVIDGGVRDAAAIRELDFPVFARAVIAAGGDKDGLGEVNITVSCGGVPVCPGDIVVGDEDGVVIIPRAEAEIVLERVKVIISNEEKKHRAIAAGQLDKTWIDKTLRERGCTFE
jgi:RraA family protein